MRQRGMQLVVGAAIGVALATAGPVTSSDGRPSAVADVVYFPASAIGISGACGPAVAQWHYQFSLTNIDGVPLQLSVKVNGSGGGTVAMSPNPVPAGGTSRGSIILPPTFSGDAETTVNFVNPEVPNGTGHTPINPGPCAPPSTVVETPHIPPQTVQPDLGAPVTTPPPIATTVPSSSTTDPPSDPSSTSASATIPDVTASTSTTTAEEPDADAAEVAAGPSAETDGGTPAWVWLVGIGAVLGAAAGTGWWWLRRRSPTS